jgi:hypothetical protein
MPRVGPAQALAQEPTRAVEGDLGYGTAFAAELQKIGQISPQEFANRYGAKTSYLAKLDWDPTTATFFDRFDLGEFRVAISDELLGGIGLLLELLHLPLGKLLCIHHPRQINGLTATVSYRPSNAKTGMGNMQVMFRDERAHNVVKAGRPTTWKRLFHDRFHTPLYYLETHQS